MGDEDIFDEEHPSEEPKEIKQEKPKEIKTKTTQETEVIKKPSHRVSLLIGLGVFVAVGVLITLAVTGIIDVIDKEPFDRSQCEFGIHSDFFGERCISEQEYNDIQQRQSQGSITPEPTQQQPIVQPVQQDYKEVSVQNPDGYYMITSADSWYGDYINGREVPTKIDLNQNTRLEFSCYTDQHLGTSVYFGTFRNNVQNDLHVSVYINGLEVDSMSTSNNKALILEGSCYGHES